MALKIQRVETWAAAMEDRPGGLAAKLNALAKARVNLEFLLARRAPDKPGRGVVFASPIHGAAACRTAKAVGFIKTKSLHTIRLEGPDKRGVGASITQALAEEGLNLRGLAATAINKKFVVHIALDTAADVSKAMRALRSL